MYENPDETEQTWQTRKQNKHGNEYPSLINNHFVTRDTLLFFKLPVCSEISCNISHLSNHLQQ